MAESLSIRILAVDDHPLMLKGLRATIDPEPDMEMVAQASTGQEAIERFRTHRPDVTIMDLRLTPEMTGIQTIRVIRREFRGARIIVLSAYQQDEEIHEALQAGAVTYFLKERLGDELIATIREVHAGGGPILPEVSRKLARLNQSVFTAREHEMLQLMSSGLRNKEIGSRLGITEQTVQWHVKNILLKLKVHDRTEAVTVAIRRGIIRLD